MEIEPLVGKRGVKITEQRPRVDWAFSIEEMLTVRYPVAQKVMFVMDTLITYSLWSLYEAFPLEKVRILAKRLENHHTTKHGS